MKQNKKSINYTLFCYMRMCKIERTGMVDTGAGADTTFFARLKLTTFFARLKYTRPVCINIIFAYEGFLARFKFDINIKVGVAIRRTRSKGVSGICEFLNYRPFFFVAGLFLHFLKGHMEAAGHLDV